ncbi:hypothetical protein [ANMV-1 virus]|nr:hypothetical protein [ANMV-1 virus]
MIEAEGRAWWRNKALRSQANQSKGLSVIPRSGKGHYTIHHSHTSG